MTEGKDALLRRLLKGNEYLVNTVMEYFFSSISELLQFALRHSMTPDWASHFYQSSLYGKQEIVIEYIAASFPGMRPTIKSLQKDLLNLFGKEPRVYRHVYEEGQDEQPTREQVLKWADSFTAKETSQLRFSVKDIKDVQFAHEMWIVKYVLVSCVCAWDQPPVKAGYVIQAQTTENYPGAPTTTDIQNYLRQHQRQRQQAKKSN